MPPNCCVMKEGLLSQFLLAKEQVGEKRRGQQREETEEDEEAEEAAD